MMRDYYNSVKDLKQGVAKQFEKADRGNFTKEYVQRLRLRRGLESPMEASGDEYGNYKKFEEGRNSVKEVNDKGYNDLGLDKFDKNI